MKPKCRRAKSAPQSESLDLLSTTIASPLVPETEQLESLQATLQLLRIGSNSMESIQLPPIFQVEQSREQLPEYSQLRKTNRTVHRESAKVIITSPSVPAFRNYFMHKEQVSTSAVRALASQLLRVPKEPPIHLLIP